MKIFSPWRSHFISLQFLHNYERSNDERSRESQARPSTTTAKKSKLFIFKLSLFEIFKKLFSSRL